MDKTMFMLAYASIPAYVVLQPLLVWRWSGGWRIAALIPLIASVPLFGHAWWAFNAGSNLWPIGLILFIPFAFLYLLMLLIVRIVRWFAGRALRS